MTTASRSDAKQTRRSNMKKTFKTLSRISTFALLLARESGS